MPVVKVGVTGAAGKIGYSILPMIFSGQMLGSDIKIDLALLDIPQCEDVLVGVAMEISDSFFPLLNSLNTVATLVKFSETSKLSFSFVVSPASRNET